MRPKPAVFQDDGFDEPTDKYGKPYKSDSPITLCDGIAKWMERPPEKTPLHPEQEGSESKTEGHECC